MGGGGGGQGGCEQRSESFVKIPKQMGGSGWGGGVGFWGGGFQGGCEWRSEAFVKIQKKKFFFGGGGGVGGRVRGGGVGLGGQDGWERRSEACVKIKKKKLGGWGLDLTKNHLKMEKKTKKEERKKFVFGAGFEPTTLRLQILPLTR